MTSNTTQGDSNLPPEEVELDELIKSMVNRFLGWKLPEDFMPDAGISFKPIYNENSPFGPSRHEPVGTNLFTATQAEVMIRHMLDLPTLLRWREAYAEKARIDELERLYLVYGSKEKPASLDNLFSLGKKGEVCATPIKDRLSALRKQQGDT